MIPLLNPRGPEWLVSYLDGEEILACDRVGITVILPKRMTSGAKSEGRSGKQDFV